MVARLTGARPGWLSALRSEGLDELSPPEVAGTLHELTRERRTFLRLMERAAGWPQEHVLGYRRPDPRDVERMDRRLPRSRAVVSPHDERAIVVAAALFRSVLVLDPFWTSRGLLYASWHDPSGLTASHATALERMARLGLRLNPLQALGIAHFVPDHLPGSWEPWPMHTDGMVSPPPLREPQATHTAARLVYWADRLRAVPVAAHPLLAGPLRAIAASGPDLDVIGQEEVISVRVESDVLSVAQTRHALGARGRSHWSRWGRLFDAQTCDTEGSVAPLARYLPATAAAAGRPESWLVGLGTSTLPDMSLVLRRAAEKRPFRPAFPGLPVPLQRRLVYLVPDQDAVDGVSSDT